MSPVHRPRPVGLDPAPAGPPALARRAAVVGAVLALVASVTLVVWNAVPALLLVFVAFLVALLLSGLAGVVARRAGLSYGPALALSGLLVVALIGAAAWFVGGGLAGQVAGVGDALPGGIERAEEVVGTWAGRVGVDEVPSVSEAAPSASELSGRVVGVVGGALGALSSALFAVLLGVFLAASPDTYRRGLLHLVPKGRRPRATEVMAAVTAAVRRWLVARLIIMATTFALTWGGLTLLGVPFAGGLAVLSALVVFVPYVGPFISGAVAVLVALLEGPQLALYTALFYLALENLQGLTIEPLIESRLTAAPPGLLVGAQVVLGFLLGAVGFVLASPLVVALTVLVQMLYVQDVLGDDAPALGQGGGRGGE